AVRLSAVWSLILFGKPTSPDDLRIEEKVLQGLTVDKPQAGRTGGKPFSGRGAIWAYVCLMRIGDVSEGYLASISKYLKSKDLQTRIHAARAFSVINVYGGSQAPALIDALVNEEEPAALIWIITALGSMGDLAKDAELQLKRLAGHKE